MTITYHANNGVTPEQTYVQTGVEKGVEMGIGVPGEIFDTWTAPAGMEFLGYSTKVEAASEDDLIPLDGETGDYLYTPTGNTDIYVQWMDNAGN